MDSTRETNRSQLLLAAAAGGLPMHLRIPALHGGAPRQDGRLDPASTATLP
jgi:hypothetical protein